VIFGIYLLTPIVSTWLANTGKREVEMMLILWGCTLVLPFVPLEFVCQMKAFDEGFLYYFYGYFGFAVLGYYLRRYVNFEKCTWRLVMAPLIIIVCVMLIYPTNIISHAVLQDRLAFPAVFLAICYFVMLKHVSMTNQIKKVVYQFARHSFGIYLVHILVMRSVLWPILEPLQIHHVIAIPMITLLTAFLSFIVVWGIGKVVPYSKYIVGV
jgi:surface polysaccharide O-acyltransferase-like enzyme